MWPWMLNPNYAWQLTWFRWALPLVLLELVLKGIALWKSAQRKQQWWFIALLVVNSLGILPIIYLLLNKKKK